MIKLNKYSKKINFLEMLSRYMKGLFKIYYSVSAQADREKIVNHVPRK